MLKEFQIRKYKEMQDVSGTKTWLFSPSEIGVKWKGLSK
jgi:hypothetical protein